MWYIGDVLDPVSVFIYYWIEALVADACPIPTTPPPPPPHFPNWIQPQLKQNTLSKVVTILHTTAGLAVAGGLPEKRKQVFL